MRRPIELAIKDAAHGDLFALNGIIDFLTQEKEYSYRRIARIAEKHFGIPSHVVLDTLHNGEIMNPIVRFRYC